MGRLQYSEDTPLLQLEVTQRPVELLALGFAIVEGHGLRVDQFVHRIP